MLQLVVQLRSFFFLNQIKPRFHVFLSCPYFLKLVFLILYNLRSKHLSFLLSL
jgi:hypothetical protein